MAKKGMGTIQTPKTVLRRGQEVWRKKDKRNSEPTKVERTGETTFNVHHDDGSMFECKIDPKKVRFKKDGLKDAGGSGRFFVPENIKIRNVMSNEDRKKLGLAPDPDLDR